METYYADFSRPLFTDDIQAKEEEFQELVEEHSLDGEEIEFTIDDIPPCGAVGCIAGNTVIIAGLGRPYFLGSRNGRDIIQYHAPAGSTWFDKAAELLGLDNEQAQRLFYPNDRFGDGNNVWPEPFASQYEKAKTPEERVAVLRPRVEHFIATNGAE